MLHLHHDNAFNVLAELPDAKFNAILTDPPYGSTALDWDKAINYAKFWSHAERITTETAVIAVFCAQPMMTDLINSNRKHFRYDLIWHKTSPVGFLDAKLKPLRAHENIAVFCRRFRGAKNSKVSIYNPQFWFSKPYHKLDSGDDRCGHYGKIKATNRGSEDGKRYPLSVMTYANRSGGLSHHPTAKPIELMRWLVNTYTNPGDLICDPFMGGGSTGVAAIELGRSFVGIELADNHFDTARQRIEQAYFECCPQSMV